VTIYGAIERVKFLISRKRDT